MTLNALNECCSKDNHNPAPGFNSGHNGKSFPLLFSRHVLIECQFLFFPTEFQGRVFHQYKPITRT